MTNPRLHFASFAGLVILAVGIALTAGSEPGSAEIVARSAIERSAIEHVSSNAPAAAVVEVFPTAPVIPENLLKLHVHFATPVGDGELPQRTYLATQAGERIEGALLTPVHELWDPTRQRLTLFLDPSRVKTGLVAHNELGRALIAGTKMQLVIEDGWTDLAGTKSQERYTRTFSIGPEDRTSPTLESWSLEMPPAGSLEPLVLRFAEPLDQACLAAFIRVLDPSDEILAGDINVSDNERTWRFTPRTAWTTASYRIAINPRIEDLAANNLLERFDHAFEPERAAIDERTRFMSFTPVIDLAARQ